MASSNDKYVTLGRAQKFAAAWESELIQIGPAGHISANTGYGLWPQGELLLQKLIQRS